MVDWNAIATVFLDLDGTLLDLRFDNHFWLEHLPLRYAGKTGVQVDSAREDLTRRYARVEGTRDWYCLNYWSRELGMDLCSLQEEVAGLIGVHDSVTDFLSAARRSGKRTVVVTNSHPDCVSLKMERTGLLGHLDGLVNAHDFGLIKEELEFWGRLQGVEPFDPAKTLLVDDNLAVLETAARYGIRHLLTILRPDTGRPVRRVDGFPGIVDFGEIIPPK